MLFVPRFRRALSEKAVICFCHCLYQVFSHILGVSLPPSACSNPLCRHPPPSSEGGEGAPAPRTQSPLCNLTQLAFECLRWRMQRGGKPLPSASARANSRSVSGEWQRGKAGAPRLARRIPPKKPRRRAKFLLGGVFYAIILAEKSLSQPQVAEVQAKACGFVRRNPA